MAKLYTVVKHAGPTWSHYWRNNPNDGVCECSSAAWSAAGKAEGIQSTHEDSAAAESDAAKLNVANPVGDYAVCPILNKGCSLCHIDDDVGEDSSTVL